MVFNRCFRRVFGFGVFLLVFVFFFAFLSFASALSTPGNISSCQELNVAGNYFLNVSLQNENVTANGCFNITASNVVLDCQNYFIRNTTLAQPGIYANTVNNITIQNCNVSMKNSGTGYGIYFKSVTSSSITNVIANGNSLGIYLSSSSDNNNLSSITANNNTDTGIDIESNSNNNQITNSTANSNYYGLYLFTGSNNTLTSITANSNYYGIVLTSSSNNTLTSITANNNSNAGIYLELNPNNNQIINATTNSNTEGIYLTSSVDSQIINSTANSNSDSGIHLESGSDNTQIINSIANNNTYGFIVIDAVNVFLQSTNASNNTYNFRFNSLPQLNQSFADNFANGKKVDYYYNVSNTVYDSGNSANTGMFICEECTNVTIKDLNLSAKNYEGLILSNSTLSRVFNVTSNGNYVGFGVYYASNNNFSNLIANNNIASGFYIADSSNNTFSGLTVYSLTLVSGVGVSLQGGEGNGLSNLNINNIIGDAVDISDSYSGGYLINSIINGTANYYGIYLSAVNKYYFINISIYNSSGFQVVNSNNSFFADLNIIDTSNDRGLVLSASYNNTIYLNFINNTFDMEGVSFLESLNNTFVNNTILNSVTPPDLTFDSNSPGNSLCGNIYGSITDSSSGQTNLSTCPNYNITAMLESLLSSYIDQTSPLVTITSPTATTYTSGAITFNVSLNKEGAVQFSLNGGTTNYTMSSTNSRNFNYSYSGLTSGSYTFRAYANDTSGNRNDTESRSFTVSISSGSSSSSSGGGGGGGSGGGASASTYSLNDNDFTNGITRDLQLNDKFKINITENHYVQVVSLGLNLVGINVSSKTQEATLSVGETRNFDVNEDGQYELAVTLEKIGIVEGVIKNATISVKRYSGEVNTNSISVNVVGSSAPKEIVKKEVVRSNADESNTNIIWILSAGILIILIVIYFVWKKKSKSLIGKVHIRHGKDIIVK